MGDPLVQDRAIRVARTPAPEGLPYRHPQTGENNADAHPKRTLLGRRVISSIAKAALDLGPWNPPFHTEFDGQRRTRIVVKVRCE